jgi:photosystem II stability/assembly factor-like uncharacterized protein
MAITRTYAVGQNNKVRRLDNHTGPWIDVSVPAIPPQMLTANWLDVMADPNDPDRVVVVGAFTGGNTGIMASNDAGVTWFQPGGNWKQGKFFYEVWWVDSTVIWIVGDGGNVVKSLDGGATFNATPTRPKPVGFSYQYTSCIHALSDQVAVVAGSQFFSLTDNDPLVWKTIDGGASWTILNGGLALVNSLPTGSPAGAPEAIWISDDEQEIIVGTTYQQFLTTNGGFAFGDFISMAAEFTRSGRHMTWFPAYGAPTHFRHVGGPVQHVNESTDTGATWGITRSLDAIIIRGAHFYSALNGYYTLGGETFSTTDGGVTGTISDPATSTGVDQMNAVWTQLQNTAYCLTNCEDPTVVLYTSNAILAPYVGHVVNMDIFSYPPDICWIVEECVPPTPWPDHTVFAVTADFADCDTCLPDPIEDSECYDLISCNGGCDDILGAQLPEPFATPPTPGSLWYINSDTTCIYEIYPLRQAFFAMTDYSFLSNPTGDFQLGTDDYTFEVTSLVYEATENITSPAISYIMNPGNYNPVEVNGNDPAIPVAPNTTENSWSNLADYLNNIFSIFGIPMEAYPADPASCEFDIGFPLSWFKVQYRDGITFNITINVTNNAGTFPLNIVVGAGNVTTQYGYPVDQITGCNSSVSCTPRLQPQINLIEGWQGECPPLLPPPELGEACEIEPRLGEVGFSWKNCDPTTVIKVKTNFADSVYALFKRMRFGIQTCCEFDLDKIDVKNQLLDLGRLLDPELCVDETPIEDCCPQPCDAIARLDIPLWVACPAPTDAIVQIDVPEPPAQLCIPPTGPNMLPFATAFLTIG